MSAIDLSTKTIHAYRGSLISVVHRPTTNDHVYIITHPMQFTGLSGTASAALKQAKKDVDALLKSAGQ